MNDRAALKRLINYAQAEAERGGEPLCAEFLAAAVVVLDRSDPASPRISGEPHLKIVD